MEETTVACAFAINSKMHVFKTGKLDHVQNVFSLMTFLGCLSHDKQVIFLSPLPLGNGIVTFVAFLVKEQKNQEFALRPLF